MDNCAPIHRLLTAHKQSQRFCLFVIVTRVRGLYTIMCHEQVPVSVAVSLIRQADDLFANRRRVVSVGGESEISFEIVARLRETFQPQIKPAALANIVLRSRIEDNQTVEHCKTLH